jgi:integrase
MSPKKPVTPPRKITKKTINALAPMDRPYTVWDTVIKGFGVKVMPNGGMSYIVQFRLGKGRAAKLFKKRIDAVGSISLEKARLRAEAWRDTTSAGTDPVKVQQDGAGRTFAKLAEDYLERHANSKRTKVQDERKLKRTLLKKLGKKPVASITHRDIEDIHRALIEAPYEANRYVALLSKMFNLAIKWGWIDKNPAIGITKYSEEPRERYLTKEEMTRFTEALSAYVLETESRWPQQNSHHVFEAKCAVNAIRLIALTGARMSEVLSSTWSQIDMETGVWTKPSSHTKQKKSHRITLSPPAIELVKSILRDIDCDEKFLFPSRRSKTGHLVGLKSVWEKIMKMAEISDLRVHDLRHSFASILASSGSSLLVIGRLLGHTQPSTTARYAHLFDDPLRSAANEVGAAYEAAKRNVNRDAPQSNQGDSHDQEAN